MRLHGRGDSHLCGFAIDPVHDSLEGRLAEAAVDASLLVIFEAGAHSFGPIVEGIPERFVDGLNTLTAGHEDLAHACQLIVFSLRQEIHQLTRSNAVEHARGWVATNTGLFDIFSSKPQKWYVVRRGM